MQRVTLENLTDYARHVIEVAESNAGHYPVTGRVQLPGLKLTAHLDHGSLSEAVKHAFVRAPDSETPSADCRIFVAHPGIGTIPDPAAWGQAHFTPQAFATRLADAGLRG